MSDTYVIEVGQYGPRLVVTSSWSSEILDAARSFDVKEIELNYAKGWKGKDIEFLKLFPKLESLEITDRSIDDVSALNSLVELRKLKVFTYCKTEIYFDKFLALEECILEWRPKASSLFSLVGLRKLFINHFPDKDLTAFSKMSGLRSFSLSSPKLETLTGIEMLRLLCFLGIYEAKKLSSLKGVESLVDLSHLEINGCKAIRDVTLLGKLGKLKELHLCNDGDIETITPLAGLHKLEKFMFYESTNVLDGNISLLKKLPLLKDVAFQDRRNYNEKRAAWE